MAPALSSVAVDAVGVAGDRRRCRAGRRARRPAPAGTRRCARRGRRRARSPSSRRRRAARRAAADDRLAVRARPGGAMPAMHLADLARLALDRVAEDDRRDAGARATSAAASSASLRRGDHAHLAAGRDAGRPAWASRPRGSQVRRTTRGGIVDAVAGRGRRARRRTWSDRARSGRRRSPPDRRRARRRSAGSRSAPAHAAAASRPPLIADRCLRTQFISAMVGAGARAAPG